LGVSNSGDLSNRFDGFKRLAYFRDVDHGQLGFLGTCPLEREITIEPTGKAQINWYAQNPQHHGCSWALNLEPGRPSSYEEWRDAAVVARTELTLTPAELDRLLEKLRMLSWEIEWTVPEEAGGTYSTGCNRVTFSPASRVLMIEESAARVASLSVYGSQERVSPSCIASETANKAALDAAFASFAPLLPEKYELRPEVARRLYREE